MGTYASVAASSLLRIIPCETAENRRASPSFSRASPELLPGSGCCTNRYGQPGQSGRLPGERFVTNPNEALDVYRGGNGVRTGLRLVSEILGELKIGEYGETIRYGMDILSLERRLRQTPKLMRSLGAGISAIQEHRHLNELNVTDEDIISRLSRLYEETAGTVQPRIRVQGQQKHLSNTMNTSRIRALLLAAIRSAVLWHQLDGRRSEWLLGRGKLLRAIDRVSEIVS